MLRYIICMLFFCCALSADTEGGFILPAGEVYRGDLFAYGKSVEISGRVEGDLYVCGEQIVVDGVVTGDLIGVGGSLDVMGTIEQSCRALVGSLLVSGTVKGNVSAVAGGVQLLTTSEVAKNVVAVAGSVNLAGRIAQDATLLASTVRVASAVHGNLQGYVGKMRLTAHARVGGDLDYRSDEEAWIDPGAEVKGQIEYHPSFVYQLIEGTWLYKVVVGSQVLVFLMNVVYTLIMGWLLLRYFPANMQTTCHTLRAHPWKSLLWGALTAMLFPVLFLLLLVTILGVPFALTLMAMSVLGFYTAKVYSIAWGVQWLLQKGGLARIGRMTSYLVGVALYFMLTAVPYLGTLVALAALFFGLGAALIAQARQLRQKPMGS